MSRPSLMPSSGLVVFSILCAACIWQPTCALNFKPCLPNPVPAKPVVDSKGNIVPLRVAAGNWDAAIMNGRIAQVIMNEAIGIEVDLFSEFGGANEVIRNMTGCKGYDTNPGQCSKAITCCTDVVDVPYTHFDFEYWYTQEGEFILRSQPTVTTQGILGYDGQEGLWVKKGMSQKIWDEHFVAVSYYQNLRHPDRKWMDGKFFNKTRDITFPAEAGCRGPSEATMNANGLVCTDGWWYSDSCINNKDTCLPVLMGSVDWLGVEAAQLLNASDIPMALTFLDWPEPRILDNSINAVFFWWRPDWTYQSVGAVERLTFPFNNRIEWNNAIYKTDFPVYGIKKHMWSKVPQLSFKAAALFESFTMTIVEIDELMQKTYDESLAPEKDRIDMTWGEYPQLLACEWVKANEHNQTASLTADGLFDGDKKVMLNRTSGRLHFNQSYFWKASKFQMNGDIEWQFTLPTLPGAEDKTFTKTVRDEKTYLITLDGKFLRLDESKGEIQVVEGEPRGDELQVERNIAAHWRSWFPEVEPCKEGEGRDANDNLCKVCKAGSFSALDDEDEPRCVQCDAGRQANRNGATECEPCDLGKFAETKGSSLCADCVLGDYQDEMAKDACKKCPSGETTQMSSARSIQQCDCEENSYRPAGSNNGQLSACEACLEGMSCAFGADANNFLVNKVSTQLVQAASAGDTLIQVASTSGFARRGHVVIAPGTSKSETNKISSFPEVDEAIGGRRLQVGLVLMEPLKFDHDANVEINMGGTDMNIPRLSLGYYSEEATPLFIYECLPSEACPGGTPQDCMAGGVSKRTGFMCSDCPDNYILTDFENQETGCSACEVQRELYLILVAIAALCLLVFELYCTKESPLDEGPIVIDIKGIGGQALMFLQILGAINTAQIDFGQPCNDFMTFLTEPISFTYIFEAWPCIALGMDDPVTSFAAKLFLPVVFLIFLLSTFLLVNVCRPGLLLRDGLYNTFGETLIEFYVSLTIGILTPFNCYDHPSDKSSMYSRPEVLCYEGDHLTMIALSVVGAFMYTISTLTISFYAAFRHTTAMARNDIGFLIRFHFLFNRWDPRVYWFCTVAVTRNAIFAILPMVIKDKGVALSFMVITLLIPLFMTAAFQPRRTPAMNALDAHMSITQMIILTVGPMLAYAEGSGDTLLSWFIMVTTISVGVVTVLLLTIKFLQFISRNRSPLSWAFDCFLDHHGGPGGTTARTLATMLGPCFRAKKFFYDVDYYNWNHSIGVIMDAAKLSKHMIVALGSETWCRHWSIAAICSAVRWKIPETIVEFPDVKDKWENVMESMDSTVSKAKSNMQGVLSTQLADSLVGVASKNAPVHLIRPYGLGSEVIPIVMENIFKNEHLEFCTSERTSVERFMKSVLMLTGPGQYSSKVTVAGGQTDASANSIVATFWEGKETPDNNILLMCDHADANAISASRLFSCLLTELIQDGILVQKTASGTIRTSTFGTPQLIMSATEKGSLSSFGLLQDYDMGSQEFADAVEKGRCPGCIVIVTEGTFTSRFQLLRLGFLQQYTPSGWKPASIAITEIFSFPDSQLLKDISNGNKLQLGDNPAQEILGFLTKPVTLWRVRLALVQLLETRILFCNAPILMPKGLQHTLLRLMIQVMIATSEPGTPCPVEPGSGEKISVSQPPINFKQEGAEEDMGTTVTFQSDTKVEEAMV